MVYPNSLPIPSFAEAMPLPSQTASAAEQWTSSRKSKENQNGIHNPIRRTFTVPVAPEEVEVHDAIRNALLYRKSKRPRKESGSKGDAIFDSEIKKSELDIKIESEKGRLKKHVKALKIQSIQAKAQLDGAKAAEAQAKQDLIRSIKERDQEMKKASATLSQTADKNEELVSLDKERNELTTVFKQMEKRLRGLEDSWEKEDEGKQKQLAKETEERKRKAAEQIDEQQKKRQRIEECEMSDIQRLEQELSEKAKELDTLKQTQSQMIWLVKQVITMQNEKKASVPVLHHF
jgi:chromosome segregation ATPase